MQHRTARRTILGPALGLALCVAHSGCGTSPPKPAAAPGEMAMPEPAAATNAGVDRPDRDDVPPAPHAHVDTSACEPAGKSVVIAARDANGRPARWRYFALRRGRRVLTCEAEDANGDGLVDARYFYDGAGRLVLEQRDLDFDGRAEVVADYTQFRRHRRVAHASGPRSRP